MTRHQMLSDLKKKFAGMEDPATEARALMREALNIGLNELVLNDQPLSVDEKTKIEKWTERRLQGEPLAYISGKKAFHKYDFKVGPGVLIPRPETELLVFVGAKRVVRSQRIRIADLGCGSGCAGLTLLKEVEQAELYSVDVSQTACDFTSENAAALGVSARTHVFKTDVNLWRPEVQFDLIVANPPYIPEDDPSVEPNVHKFEPHEALYSGPDGLQAIGDWVTWAPGNLRKDGILALEIGAGQSASVSAIMAQAGFVEIQVQKDFAGIDRIISGKRGTQHG